MCPSQPTLQPVSRPLQQILLDENSYATTLLAILIDRYGTEALAWHPETIRQEFRDDAQVELPQHNLDKILAGVSIVTSDDFFQRLHPFIVICNVLAGGDFDTDSFEIADARACGWGIVESMLLRPPEDNAAEPFSDEIRRYIGKVLDREGIRNPPDVLQIGIRNMPMGMSPHPNIPMTPDGSEEISDMIHENLTQLISQLKRVPWLSADPDALKSLRFS